jgi:hypothetical protein
MLQSPQGDSHISIAFERAPTIAGRIGARIDELIGLKSAAADTKEKDLQAARAVRDFIPIHKLEPTPAKAHSSDLCRPRSCLRRCTHLFLAATDSGAAGPRARRTRPHTRQAPHTRSSTRLSQRSRPQASLQRWRRALPPPHGATVPDVVSSLSPAAMRNFADAAFPPAPMHAQGTKPDSSPVLDAFVAEFAQFRQPQPALALSRAASSTSVSPAGLDAMPHATSARRPLSTEKCGAPGIVVNRRCRSLRRTSNVGGTERGMLKSKEILRTAEIGITNKQTTNKYWLCDLVRAADPDYETKARILRAPVLQIENDLRCAPLCGLDCVLNVITSVGSNSRSAPCTI